MRGFRVAGPLLAACLASQAFPLEIVATIPDIGWPSPVVPMTVTLVTEADTHRGAVVIRDGTFNMRIPVDMPPNTTRELNFPVPTRLRNYQMYFEGGGIPLQIEPPIPDSSRDAVLVTIGDTPGLLNALKDDGNELDFERPGTSTWHWEPGKVPLQVGVLMNLHAIILADGADRLKDEEVRALRDYVLLGGTLVIPGGASALTARDPRWTDWLPATLGDPRTIPASEIGLQGNAQAAFTVRTLSPLPGSESLSPFLVRRAFGLGCVVLTAYDLLDNSVRADAKFEERFLEVTTPPMASARQESRMFAPTTEQSETFRVRPPGFWQIFGWLLAYILIVGPLNFLVLSKLNLKELAWFTAPILSLAFAGVVVAQSQVRRTSGAAHGLEGIIVADSTSNRALVSGRQLLFFPDGGNYDLKMPNVTSVWFSGNRNDNPLSQIAGNRGIFADGIVYSDHFDFTRVMAKSLAYEEFFFVQEVERSISVSARAVRVSTGVFQVTIKNEGAEPLKDLSVSTAGYVRQGSLTDTLVPGDELTKEVRLQENERNKLGALMLIARMDKGGAEVGTGETNLELRQTILIGGAP